MTSTKQSGDAVVQLATKLADAEGRLVRLYAAIEAGIADPSDVTLKDRIAAIKSERDIARVALDRATEELSPAARLTANNIAAATEMMRSKILEGETAFRRAYLRAVIDKVEVDDTEIRIKGRKSVLERLVMAGGAEMASVPSFVREWRTRHDSNVWPSPSEGNARTYS